MCRRASNLFDKMVSIVEKYLTNPYTDTCTMIIPTRTEIYIVRFASDVNCPIIIGTIETLHFNFESNDFDFSLMI